MPVFRNHTTLEIARGVKAFLNLSAGLTRGTVPDPEQQAKTQLRRIEELQKQLSERRKPDAPAASRRVEARNIVWILGSPRTGSTWLSRTLRGLQGYVLWDEPFFGVVLGFRDNFANKGRVEHKNFVLGDAYKDVWLRSMRNLFLDVCEARFPNIGPNHHLVVKEPNGSLSAPLIMEAFPESKLIFLTRDARDVVASLLDAAKRNSEWYPYESYEASLAEATMQNGRFVFPHHESDDAFVEQLARNYVTNTGAVREAYEKHPGGSKVLLHYEDLRTDPFGRIKEAYRTLGLRLNETQLAQAVEDRSWENIPKENKGEGKFFRKARPGSWREDLTPGQAEIVERVLAEASNS